MGVGSKLEFDVFGVAMDEQEKRKEEIGYNHDYC